MGLRTGLVTFVRVQDKFHSIESIKAPPFISSSVIDRTPESRGCSRRGTRTKAEEAQHKTLKQAILKEAQVSQNLLVRDSWPFCLSLFVLVLLYVGGPVGTGKCLEPTVSGRKRTCPDDGASESFVEAKASVIAGIVKLR
jgi:hypothetical protein